VNYSYSGIELGKMLGLVVFHANICIGCQVLVEWVVDPSVEIVETVALKWQK